ncbi:MAG: hypothetical protein L3J35_06145 [Bacteroidales bacterium]|nr:hypothetical protein [Bacteroidales bacterium]
MMVKKKAYFLIFFIILNNLFIFSQEYDPYTYQNIKEESTLNEKIFFGGGFGLQFGTSIVLKLTPEAGYRILPNVETGIGGYYLYAKNYSYNLSDNVYGGKVFSRLFIYNDIFLQSEYEMLNIADYDISTYYYTGERIFIPGFLGGIGYRQKIGKRTAFLSSIFYNFSINEKTPYRNPVIRFTMIF